MALMKGKSLPLICNVISIEVGFVERIDENGLQLIIYLSVDLIHTVVSRCAMLSNMERAPDETGGNIVLGARLWVD